MASWIAKQKSVLLFLAVSGSLGVWLSWVVLRAEDKTPLLPGVTTDGHYQIEMQCEACHVDEPKKNIFTSSGVTNAACMACHGEDLESFSDSHPVRKFRNPENAIFLEHINAMNCVTCHREHNEKITGAMAVTIPGDYCAHCHEVTLENLPSHRDLSFQSCATAGCHNFHDNMALSPGYLLKHYGEPDHRPDARIPETTERKPEYGDAPEKRDPLTLAEADAPSGKLADHHLNDDWLASAHARAGINCRDCHDDPGTGNWISAPGRQVCASCHETEDLDFLKGKHGMRLAHASLPPMTPGEARRPMKPGAAHETLDCNSCHSSHRYDRQYAAQGACIQCHDDEHTRNYAQSKHHALWRAEVDGHAETGTGVSCATCHLPRIRRGGQVIVNHNQSDNLTPNEKMLRNVCMQCHGLQFGMDALADRDLIRKNFAGRPAGQHPGISWAVEAAVKRGDEDIIRLREYLQSPSGNLPAEPDSPNQD